MVGIGNPFVVRSLKDLSALLSGKVYTSPSTQGRESSTQVCVEDGENVLLQLASVPSHVLLQFNGREKIFFKLYLILCMSPPHVHLSVRRGHQIPL